MYLHLLIPQVNIYFYMVKCINSLSIQFPHTFLVEVCDLFGIHKYEYVLYSYACIPVYLSLQYNGFQR